MAKIDKSHSSSSSSRPLDCSATSGEEKHSEALTGWMVLVLVVVLLLLKTLIWPLACQMYILSITTGLCGAEGSSFGSFAYTTTLPRAGPGNSNRIIIITIKLSKRVEAILRSFGAKTNGPNN